MHLRSALQRRGRRHHIDAVQGLLARLRFPSRRLELLLDALRLLVSIVGALVRLRRFQTFDLGGVELRKEPRDGSFAFLSRGVEASYFILEFPQDCGVRVFCGFCTIRLCLYTICLC